MTQKERKAELERLTKAIMDFRMMINLPENIKEQCKGLAEYLLYGIGVIVPPCKVGDTVWFHTCSEEGCLSTAKGEVTAVVEREGRDFLEIYSYNIILGRLFDEVYLTCEAAEQALKECET